MIQRIKKPEIKPKEERKKSPKREKPLINNKNVNNNVNTNNIVVNIPQVAPIAPKKRKRKPKIANTAKQEFQDTLNEYAQGNYPPIDIPDITTIKTSGQLNNITNQMRSIMGKAPQLAIMGGQTPPAIMGSSSGSMVPPSISNPYPGTRGNAFTNIVPTIQPSTGSIQPTPPPPPPAPTTPIPAPTKIISEIPELMGDLLAIMDKIVKKHEKRETFNDDYSRAINLYNQNKEYYNTVNNGELKAYIMLFIGQTYPFNDSEYKLKILESYLWLIFNYFKIN